MYGMAWQGMAGLTGLVWLGQVVRLSKVLPLCSTLPSRPTAQPEDAARASCWLAGAIIEYWALNLPYRSLNEPV